MRIEVIDRELEVVGRVQAERVLRRYDAARSLGDSERAEPLQPTVRAERTIRTGPVEFGRSVYGLSMSHVLCPASYSLPGAIFSVSVEHRGVGVAGPYQTYGPITANGCIS